MSAVLTPGFRCCRTLVLALLVLGLSLAGAAQTAKAVRGGDRISSGFFSHSAVGVTAGTLGIGGEFVTTVSRRSNLRVDAQFLGYNHTFTTDGVDYAADIKLQNARLSYDFYPFHGGFRISAGVAMYNNIDISAGATVPSTKAITFNDTDYYSSASDPLKGSASVKFAHKVGPTLSFGWGNAIPRSGRHLAFPIEIGAVYTGTPAFNLNMSGSACSSPNDPGTCEAVAGYQEFQTNLAAEKKKITDDLKPLQFYPIVNIGMTYRF